MGQACRNPCRLVSQGLWEYFSEQSEFISILDSCRTLKVNGGHLEKPPYVAYWKQSVVYAFTNISAKSLSLNISEGDYKPYQFSPWCSKTAVMRYSCSRYISYHLSEKKNKTKQNKTKTKTKQNKTKQNKTNKQTLSKTKHPHTHPNTHTQTPH